MTPGIGAGLLTRTTLQVDGTLAGDSVTHMIRALQRVPGVLLAEVNGANDGADVAHDAAVPTTSLIAAAQNAGVHVRIVGDTRVPTLAANQSASLHLLATRQFLIAAVSAFVVLTIVNLLAPNAAEKHGVLIGLTAVLWAVFLAKSFIAHRRS